MNPSLKLLLPAVLALCAAAPLAARELTEADAQMVLDCINNVDPAKNLLSPAKADECNDQFTEGGGELMDKAPGIFRRWPCRPWRATTRWPTCATS